MSGESALLVRVLRQKFARFTLAHLATSCPTMGHLVFTLAHHPLMPWENVAAVRRDFYRVVIVRDSSDQ